MHLLVKIQNRAKPKLGAVLEKSERQCLRDSCKGDAGAEQRRTMLEKGRGGHSKPSARAGLEQVQDGQDRLEQSRHSKGTVQAHFQGQR